MTQPRISPSPRSATVTSAFRRRRTPTSRRRCARPSPSSTPCRQRRPSSCTPATSAISPSRRSSTSSPRASSRRRPSAPSLDSEQALALLKRFGSVTVLNGHIHQVLQKVEGNITFHTAFSTAFPQPAPGTADSPGPLQVPAEKLRATLGMHRVDYRVGESALAIVDTPLANG